MALIRMALIRTLAGLALSAAALTASAQYPSRPIKILIGFPPGSGGETQVRLVGQKLTEAWGQPIIVDARTSSAADSAVATNGSSSTGFPRVNLPA